MLRTSEALHVNVESGNPTYSGLHANAEAAVAFTEPRRPDPADGEPQKRTAARDALQSAVRWARVDGALHVTAATLPAALSSPYRTGLTTQGVWRRATSRPAVPSLSLHPVMEDTLDAIEGVGTRGGAVKRVPTGFADLDELTNGLHPGQLIVFAGRPRDR